MQIKISRCGRNGIALYIEHPGGPSSDSIGYPHTHLEVTEVAKAICSTIGGAAMGGVILISSGGLVSLVVIPGSGTSPVVVSSPDPLW